MKKNSEANKTFETLESRGTRLAPSTRDTLRMAAKIVGVTEGELIRGIVEDAISTNRLCEVAKSLLKSSKK